MNMTKFFYMKVQNYILLFFISISTMTFAQSGDFIKGNKAFDNGEFGKAENIFRNAYQRSNDRAEKNEIGFKLAQCYFFLGDFKKAETNFRRTIKMRYDNPLVHYYLAECYKGMEKFDKAQIEYEKFIKLDPENPKGPFALESLELTQEWIQDGSKYRVVNAGSDLNSKADDFSPVIKGKKNDELFFTSSRDGVLGRSTNQITGQYFTDIFSIKKPEKKGKSRKTSSKVVAPPDWDETTLTNIDAGLADIINLKNSEEGVISFNKRGNKIFFTRSIFTKNRYQGRRIYSANFRGKKFRDVTMEMIPVDTLVDVHGPSISPDEKSLFFAAEIDGGFGGSDIYVSRYDRRKKSWGEPENLGPNVNSEGDEGFPVFSASTNNLYFSSNGRPGMGVLDIFKAEYNVNFDGTVVTMFNEAENLQYPVNTCFDDFGITFENYSQAGLEPELKGYFSSNRVGSKWKSKGKVDIYYFDKQQIFFNLSGQIVDVADGSPIQGAQIELIGPSSSNIAHTDGFGKFSFDECNFREDEDYRIVVNKEWFFQQVDTTLNTHNIKNRDCEYITKEMEEANAPNTCSYQEGHLEYSMYRKFEMKTMRRPLVLKSVLFDLGKSDLREASKNELDSLVSLLNNDWPNVVIELRSHTDIRGSDTLNARLSFDRAQSCVDYLVEQGVNPARLVPLGMASTEPVILEESEDNLPVGELNANYIANLKSKKLREIAHQKNRRTDFKVLDSNLDDWLKKNPNLKDENDKIQRALIDKEGNVIPTDSKGNFIEQIN
ncbi:MAG: hypothetical protein CMP49_05535 [Flavobacteriales bacterium]|nr:hypothetical protein [Flavobacteriales bacterium]